MSHVQPQPIPYTWEWEQVPGTIKRTPESEPEHVTFLKWTCYHYAGRFSLLMLPEDWDKLIGEAQQNLALNRSGLVIGMPGTLDGPPGDEQPRRPPGPIPPGGPR